MIPSKRILITGATRGLGRALVDGFAALGRVVIGCGRSEQAIRELSRRYSAPHSFAVVDVANGEQAARWADAVLAVGRAPDLLINNAAIINRRMPLWEQTAEAFDAVIDVNIKGTANVLRAFLPAMIDRGRGVIVNLSSGWGRSTAPHVAAYCASKFAIEGLTQSLAQELPPGMAAVPLNPGVIDTAMLREGIGDSAGDYPDAQAWAKTAVPFLLQLGPKDNGRSLTVPDVGHPDE